MVWFAPEPPSVEDFNPERDSKLKSSKDSSDILDTQPNDFSFADSFLDFDSIKDWFEDRPIAGMAAQDDVFEEKDVGETAALDQQVYNGSNSNGIGSTAERVECENGEILSCTIEGRMGNGCQPITMESTPAASVERTDCETLGIQDCDIEEGMGKVSLVGGSESSVIIKGDGVNREKLTGKDESESSESESASPSSSSSSTSSSGSSDDDDDEEEEEEDEQQEEKRLGHGEYINADVEEGEIIDSDGQEVNSETKATDDDDEEGEDEEKMVSWCGINNDDVDDDDDASNIASGPIRSKNELKTLPPVPKVNVTLEAHQQMLPVGIVMSIVGAQVIVEGVEKHDPLNEGSVLWMTKSRTPLGLVDEIFGPVKNPYYVVRYDSENEIPAGINAGALISFVPEFASHVLNNKDLYKKGYDASGLNDEELSDEAEFSDDEKEAEYKRMHRMTKRGNNDQNPGKRKNNKKTAQLLGHGNCVPFSGVRQGHLGATTMVPPFSTSNVGPNSAHIGATTIVPPFPTSNVGPNSASNGVWTNGITLPQPQSPLLPDGFPTNGMPWFPQNTQNSYQLPMQGFTVQQQLDPNLGSLLTTMLPGVQPNIFAQPQGPQLMYAQGLAGQNQMTTGLSSCFPQIQQLLSAGEQGILSNELHSQRNLNLHYNTVPGNHHAPGQFHPGPSAGHGRKTYHPGPSAAHERKTYHPGPSASHGRKRFHPPGRKGWRPAK